MVIFIHSALCLKKNIYMALLEKEKTEHANEETDFNDLFFTLHVKYKIARTVHKAKRLNSNLLICC